MKLKKLLSAVLSATVMMLVPVTVHSASAVRGDATGDGVVNVRDAAFIASSLAQGKALSTSIDYNGDGVVNVRDAAAIAKDISKGYIAEQMLKQVNEVRAKAGSPPLVLNYTMNDMASERAEEITTFFSHTRPDGTDCWTIGEEYGINFYGENIAAGNSTVEATMNQWINSPGHYENMINPSFTELGVGYNKDLNAYYRHYWVQIFR